MEGAGLSRVLPENDIPTWLSPCGAASTIDHFLLPDGTAGSARVLKDSGFPSDHFPVTLSAPSARAFRDDELLIRRTRFHLSCKDSAAAYERYASLATKSWANRDPASMAPRDISRALSTVISASAEEAFGMAPRGRPEPMAVRRIQGRLRHLQST